MRLLKWKREQKSRRRKKFTVFILLVMGILSIFALRTIQTGNLPKIGRTTIVLATEPVLVVSFEPQNPLVILSIPQETYLEATRGFGSYRIGALWSLGGGQLLEESTQEFLGLPVDGWIGEKSGEWKLKSDKDTIFRLKNQITSWKVLIEPKKLIAFTKNLETNLTPVDIIKLWWQIKNTRFDKIYFLDLADSGALSKFPLKDGSFAFTAETAKLDFAIGRLFNDSQIAGEKKLIEILNSTGKPGLANRFSRLITNLGGEVIALDNSSPAIKKCLIKGDPEAIKSATAYRLGQIFNCRLLPEKPPDSRADLTIIIGSDYWQKLFLPQ